MKRLLAVLLFAIPCAAQNRYPAINLYTGDPVGVACATDNTLVQSTTTGGIYSCFNGNWITIASGSVSLAPSGTQNISNAGGQTLYNGSEICTVLNGDCGAGAALPSLAGGTMWAASGAPGSTSTTPVESFATHSPSQIVNDACPTYLSPVWHLNGSGNCVSGAPTDNQLVMNAIGASGRHWVFPTTCDGNKGAIYFSKRVDVTVDNTGFVGGSVGSPTSLTNGCRTNFYAGDITNGAFRVRGVNHTLFKDFNLTCPATATPATTGCQAGTIGIDGANIDGTHTGFSGDDLEMINVGIDGFSQVINWWGYQNYIIDTTANSYPGENNPGIPAAVIGGTTPNEGRIRNFMVHCGTINTGHQTASSAIQMQNGGFGGDFHVGDNVGSCAGTGGVYNLGAFGGWWATGDTEGHTGPQTVLNGTTSWTVLLSNYTNPQNSTGPDFLTSGTGGGTNLIGSTPTLPNATNYPVFSISHTAAATACAGGNRFYTMQNNNPRGSGPQSPEQLVTISAGDSVTLTWTQLWGVQYYTVNEGATTGSELVVPVKLQGDTVTWTDNCTLTPSGSPPAGGTMRYAEIGMIAEKDNVQALIAANDGSGATSGDVNYMMSTPKGEYVLATSGLRTLDTNGACPSAVWANRGMITRGMGSFVGATADAICYSYWNGSTYTSTNLLSFLGNLKASTSLSDNTTGTVLYISQTGTGTANPLVDLWSNNASGVDYPIRVTNTNSGGSLIRGYTTGSAYIFSLGVAGSFFNTTFSINPAAGSAATLSTPVNSNNFFLNAYAWCGGASTGVDLKMRVLPTAGLDQPISYYFNPDLGVCGGKANLNLSQFTGGMYIPDSLLMTAGFNASTKALPTCNNSTGALGGIYGVNDSTTVTAGAVYVGGGTGVTHVHCTVLSSVYNWYVM